MKTLKNRRKKRQDHITDELIAKALKTAWGRQCQAADMLNLSNAAITERIKKSPYLQQIKEECKERICDEYEKALHTQAIKEKNITGVIFFLKTKAKHRGYQESSHVTVSQEYVDAADNVVKVVRQIQDNLKTSNKSPTKE